MEFYGRQTQQKKLWTLLRRDSMQIALVFGRRRVGKSELIKHCLRQEPVRHIYYECKQTTEQNNVESIVTQDPNGFAFYEAKFRKEPISEGMIREEMKQVQNRGLTCYKFGFFSRSGFSCQPESSTVSYTLADLYA